MYCETRGHHGHGRRHCGCGQGNHGDSCECGRGFGRRFLTKEEKSAGLQEYLENLQREAQAVEERIAALKGD
jgi:ribosomal protein L9